MILNLSASDVTVRAAEPDGAPSRTIEGVAVPWNVDAVVSDGTTVRFLPGSLPEDGPSPKFIRDHQLEKPIGIVSERVDTGDVMMFAARVSATRDGDEALTLALDGVLDSVSVGVEPVEYTFDGPTLVVSRGIWRELSLVPFGAFADARVASVAATTPTPEPVDEPEDGKESPPVDTPTPAPVEAAPAVVPTAPLTLSAAPRLTPATWLSFAARGREHEILATAAEGVIGDVPGIMPEPLIGSIYDTLNSRRPFVSAVGTRAMPAGGETFYRRKITQHTDVTLQAAEFDELASQALLIDRVQVDKKTYGGYVDLSEQMVDWTDPAAVGLVLEDLARVYAKATETAACSILTTGAVVDEEIDDWSDGDEVLDALYDASNTIMAAIDSLPTHLMVSPDRYADLGKMKDANGNRLFPAVGPSNAAGSVVPTEYRNVLGLTVVVSPQFSSGTFILGSPQGIELFENQKGSIRVDQPATLSTRLAFRGYFTGVVIDSGAFVALVDPAPAPGPS